MRLKRYWPFLLILGMFFMSVVIRLGAFNYQPINGFVPDFDRFLNTEVYQHVSFVMDTYSKYPISEHLFGPYIGGAFPEHKDLPLYVYTSFPPAMFIVPWVVFKLLGITVTLNNLQIFGLAVHLLTTVLVYLLVRTFLTIRKSKGVQLIAVLSASAYLFATGTLHNHMSVWWAHELLQPVFIASLLLFVRRRGEFRWWEAALVGFLLSIITWTGVMASIGFFLYFLYRFIKTRDRAHLFMLLGMGGGAAFALLLIVGQVFALTGLSAGGYWESVTDRVHARSSLGGSISPFIWLRMFMWDLILDYGMYLAVAIACLIRYWDRFRSFDWAVLFIAAFPLVETIPLLAHDTDYGFGRLKWLLPTILAMALGSAYFLRGGGTRRKIILVAIFTIAAVMHVGSYLLVYILTKH